MVKRRYAQLFLASYHGEAIAGALAFIMGDKAWYLYGASSNRHRNLMPNHLLQWTMILWAKERGCRSYDFRGVSGDLNPDNPLYGLYRFKKGFEGTLTEFIGEYDRVYSPFLYWLWRKVYPLYAQGFRNLLLGRKRGEGKGPSWGTDLMEKGSYTDWLGTRWIEIEASFLEHNVKEILSRTPPGTRLLAVVKADACGLGLEEASRIFLAAGTHCLGVATLEEGKALRRAGIKAPILVLTPLLREEVPEALNLNLTLSLATPEGVEAVRDAAQRLRKRAVVHVEVDTGFHRSGFSPQEALPLIRELAGCPWIQVEGIFTHPASGGRLSSIKRQWGIFQQLLQHLQEEGLSLPLRHFCNSAAFMLHPQAHLDLVRIGTLF